MIIEKDWKVLELPDGSLAYTHKDACNLDNIAAVFPRDNTHEILFIYVCPNRYMADLIREDFLAKSYSNKICLVGRLTDNDFTFKMEGETICINKGNNLDELD